MEGAKRSIEWYIETYGKDNFFLEIQNHGLPEEAKAQVGARHQVHSKTIAPDAEGDPKSFYYQINDIVSQNKKYYLTQSTSIFSTGLSAHYVKIFSIEDGQLNDAAQLIKTQTGIRNQLQYEVDLTASANRNNEIRNYNIEYDKKNKIISIPLILDDYKITSKKIRYQFKGKYFEKI